MWYKNKINCLSSYIFSLNLAIIFLSDMIFYIFRSYFVSFKVARLSYKVQMKKLYTQKRRTVEIQNVYIRQIDRFFFIKGFRLCFHLILEKEKQTEIWKGILFGIHQRNCKARLSINLYNIYICIYLHIVRSKLAVYIFIFNIDVDRF